jgi:transcription elongation GreA/GreB family factor
VTNVASLNKQDIIEGIIAVLESELETLLQSAREARAGATDEQAKAENKYDTRGLEASYLADGQSRQALEAMQAIQLLRALPLRDYDASEPIDLGALVELEQKGGKTCFIIVPRAGGTEVKIDGTEILALTPQSPLGQQLVGLHEGATFDWGAGRSRETYRVARVH